MSKSIENKALEAAVLKANVNGEGGGVDCVVQICEKKNEMKYNKNPQVFGEGGSDGESTPAKNCDHPKAESLEGEEAGF